MEDKDYTGTRNRPKYMPRGYKTQLSTKFILLINVKMPTIFMNSWNLVLIWVEHEKSFI